MVHIFLELLYITIFHYKLCFYLLFLSCRNYFSRIYRKDKYIILFNIYEYFISQTSYFTDSYHMNESITIAKCYTLIGFEKKC